MERHTFEYMDAPYRSEWIKSKQRFDSQEQAAKAACDWLLVNAENGHGVCVRLATAIVGQADAS